MNSAQDLHLLSEIGLMKLVSIRRGNYLYYCRYFGYAGYNLVSVSFIKEHLRQGVGKRFLLGVPRDVLFAMT